jgi:hypothetical protein
MPAPVVYCFSQGGHRRELIFARVTEAAYSTVMDLHDREAEPGAITWQGRVLLDRAAIERVWAACRPELVADRWKVPVVWRSACACFTLTPWAG